MLKDGIAQETTHRNGICRVLFRGDGLLVQLHCGSRVGVTQKFLGSFQVDTLLAKHGPQAMAEGMPPDPLLDPKSLQCRTNVPTKHHVRRDRMGTIVFH